MNVAGGGGNSRRSTWNPHAQVPPSPIGSAITTLPSPTMGSHHRPAPSMHAPLKLHQHRHEQSFSSGGPTSSPLVGALGAGAGASSAAGSRPLARLRANGDSPERGIRHLRQGSTGNSTGLSALLSSPTGRSTNAGLGSSMSLMVDELPSARAISPRHSARLTQTAAIRATLARQQSGLNIAAAAQAQQQQQQQQASSPPTTIIIPVPEIEMQMQFDTAPSERSVIVDSDSLYSSGGSSSSSTATAGSTSSGDSSDRSSAQQRRERVFSNRRRHTAVEMSSNPSAAANNNNNHANAAAHMRFLSPASMDGAVAPSMIYNASRDGSPTRRASLSGLSSGSAGATARRGTARVGGRGRGPKLALIVDGSTMARSLTHAGLHCAGFGNCDGATEGESAVQMTRIQRYDLIILSDPSPLPPPKSATLQRQSLLPLQTAAPTMSIVDTARSIRSFEEKAGEVPAIILALTSAVDPASLAAYEAAGMSGAIQRNAMLAVVIKDTLDTLQRNQGFVFIAAGGAKTQSTQQMQQLQQQPPVTTMTPAATAIVAPTAPPAANQNMLELLQRSASPFFSPSPNSFLFSSGASSSSCHSSPLSLPIVSGNSSIHPSAAAAASVAVPHTRMASTSLRRDTQRRTTGTTLTITTVMPTAAAAATTNAEQPAVAAIAAAAAAAP